MSSRAIVKQPELWIFGAILAALNLHVLGATWLTPQFFYPEALADGEWWRIVTWPFVHISWWHLLLDGAAFFMLYRALEDHSLFARAGALLACGIGTVAIPLIAGADIWNYGLCGLSGVAHGLMAVSAIIFLRSDDRVEKGIGGLSLAIVLLKCMYEALTGDMLFEFIYFGLVGTPIALCHAGGVLGGLVAALCLRPQTKEKLS